MTEPRLTQGSEPIVGRFAPSPTGDFHLGNLRTALLAWGYARIHGGRFHLRMEDLDDRARPEFPARQLADLEALGIDWDGDVEYQSRNTERYEAAAAALERAGLLYECYCTRKEILEAASAPHAAPGAYPGTCRHLSEAEREAGRAKLAHMSRGPALRLATDGGEVALVDEICGPYSGLVDDIVIRRGDGVWAYNFVSVVDDAAAGVTHVVRGDDLLSSTPRQIALARLLGLRESRYVHVPLVLNPDGVRLAKRDGAVTLADLATYGWTPADVLHLLSVSLGWAPARTPEEFLAQFAARGADAIPHDPWLCPVADLPTGPSLLATL